VSCPLCFSSHHEVFDVDRFRTYLLCKDCALVFVPREELISGDLEKKRYESHHNSENNLEYKKYLQKTANHMASFLKKGTLGLDFGCGKTRILEEYLEKDGLDVLSYDLFFYPDVSVFEQKFHFIVLSEVIEHLRKPSEEMRKLTSLLDEDGLIFIKTKLRPQKAVEFKDWFYKRDMTHIQFFSESSFEKLSMAFNLTRAMQIDHDLFLFRKNG
jgi:hypothetical protein